MEEAELIVKFPWKRGNCFNCSFDLNQNARPGEYVLQTLFLEFCSVVERKIEQVLAEPLERFLSRSLQRNEDSQFDQILSALGCVAEQSLPSLLQTLFKWYERQSISDDGITFDKGRSSKNKGEKDFLCERRELAVEFVYCLALIEILPKLIYHPGHDDLVNHIITQSFRHFKYKDGIQSNPNAANINLIADLYAEVVGVLAQSRFSQVRKTFVNELKELKLRDQTPYTTQSIISLLMGLKFFRVKMHPIEDFQACLQFLHELGHYFLEVKDRDIRHALSMLFVEILLPVAAASFFMLLISKRSCTSNLLAALDKWTEQLDTGIPVDAIYLDFTKVFNNVPHLRLLRKLESYGVNLFVLKWIWDFLVGRG